MRTAVPPQGYFKLSQNSIAVSTAQGTWCGAAPDGAMCPASVRDGARCVTAASCRGIPWGRAARAAAPRRARKTLQPLRAGALAAWLLGAFVSDSSERIGRGPPSPFPFSGSGDRHRSRLITPQCLRLLLSLPSHRVEENPRENTSGTFILNHGHRVLLPYSESESTFLSLLTLSVGHQLRPRLRRNNSHQVSGGFSLLKTVPSVKQQQQEPISFRRFQIGKASTLLLFVLSK